MSINKTTISEFNQQIEDAKIEVATTDPAGGMVSGDSSSGTTGESIAIELDPIFTESPAYSIKQEDIFKWNSSFTWGNHGDEGYLKNVDVSDINTTNSPVDGQIIRYNVSSNSFEWINPPETEEITFANTAPANTELVWIDTSETNPDLDPPLTYLTTVKTTDLVSINTPSDGQYLSFDSVSGDFVWNTVAQGPSGNAATIMIGSVITGAANSNVSVLNSGNTTAAVLDFSIPKGEKGDLGITPSITVGNVTESAPGSNAVISNVGTETEAIFDFTIPRGSQGPAGSLTIGSVETGAPGSNVSIINTGTTGEAILDITIPQGEQGEPGVGIPYGGSTGEILFKLSNTDQDYEWRKLDAYDFDAAKRYATYEPVTPSTGTVSFDLSNGQNFSVTLTENTAFNFLNQDLTVGQNGIILIIEDAIGGWTFSLDSNCKTPVGGLSIVQSTAPNTKSILNYIVVSDTEIFVNYLGDFA